MSQKTTKKVNIGTTGTLPVSGTVDLRQTLVQGVHYQRNSNAVTLVTLVTPAANVNGVLVDIAHMFVNSGGTPGTLRLMAKATAPTSAGDVGASDVLTVTGYGGIFHVSPKAPMLIPAGLGLYEQSDAANQTGLSLTYKVL